MNKFKVLTLGALLLSVAACGEKSSSGTAHKQFVAMCQEDPRSKDKNFDCVCQADILEAVLLEKEMTNLLTFLNLEKTDREKAMEMGKDPQYIPMFQKIGGIGLAIHDKCGKAQPATPAVPEAAPAEGASPDAAPAAATETPAETPAQ